MNKYSFYSNRLSRIMLSQLPVNVFIHQITYLPFKDVVNVCSANQRLRNFCTSPNYRTNWKRLIDDTFQNTVEMYPDKLNQLWNKLGSAKGTYNYLVYTQLVKLLDPITQGMIYYLRGDMESFNQLTQTQKFLGMFLLKQPSEMEKYLPDNKYLPFISLLQGDKPDQTDLDRMLIEMAGKGNIKGVKYFEKLGESFYPFRSEDALKSSSQGGHLDVVKYLVKQGTNIHNLADAALRSSSQQGHLDIVKYLVEQRADIHVLCDAPLRLASDNGHLDVVKYLLDKGGNTSTLIDKALDSASFGGHLRVVKFIVERSTIIHPYRYETALINASENGYLDIVKYLVEQGANVHARRDMALILASRRGHLDVVKYIEDKMSLKR